MEYSILVNSCDAYKDAWPFFFFLLHKNWKSDKIPKVYLNTETEEYTCEYIDVTVLNSYDKNCEWGERLIDSLNRIETDFVLMMLEDFYYESPICVDIIDYCVEQMRKDSSILSFQMVPASEVYRKEVKPQKIIHPGFALRERTGTYTFIAGPTLWRKKDLMALTKKGDSPWEFEWYGSLRTQLFGKKIFCWISFEEPIFDYDIEHGGAIHGGKWVGYKVKELAKKYNYQIEYGDREVVEDWLKEPKDDVVHKHKKNLFQKQILSRVKNFMYFIRKDGNILYGLFMGIKVRLL